MPEVEKYVIIDDHKILKINDGFREPKRMLAFANKAKEKKSVHYSAEKNL